MSGLASPATSDLPGDLLERERELSVLADSLDACEAARADVWCSSAGTPVSASPRSCDGSATTALTAHASSGEPVMRSHDPPAACQPRVDGEQTAAVASAGSGGGGDESHDRPDPARAEPLLRARRGDPDPWTPLEEAREVAERTGQLWWKWQIAAAEALWLRVLVAELHVAVLRPRLPREMWPV